MTLTSLREGTRNRAAPAFAYVPDMDCPGIVGMLLDSCIPGAVLDDLMPPLVVP